MEISRRTDYAIRLVAALLQNEGKPLSVRAAAELQDVPYSFARSIQHDLTRSGVITTLRGSHGGMKLAIDPNEFTLTELIETMQGPISLSICMSQDGWCPRDKACVFHSTWAGGSNILRDYFSSVTIKELLDGKRPQIRSHGD
ncbi:MAG: Rrf2 family transcriptional regulator [Coriobacteriales bacterium]|jgi:Rrf2 family protein|nr:Rrf2 family transcriptional regulator [Coriobacteriales bacterium]